MARPYNAVILKNPHYKTSRGIAVCGDALLLMQQVKDDSIDLILTSPPFALVREKEYGNVPAESYVEWFMQFAQDFYRILKPSGSLVMEIGGTWNEGIPTRSLYHFQLLLELCNGPNGCFHLAQEFYWYNTAKLPTPAQWVAVERVRVKDAVTPIWWLSKTESPKADNREVLKPYSQSMKRLLKQGYYNAGPRPSGHDIPEKSFIQDNKGAIPGNLIAVGNTDSNSRYMRRCREQGVSPHPARFSRAIPEFFIGFLTSPGDWILDPFAGSNMTGMVAETNGRNWLSTEIHTDYWENSKLRFDDPEGYAQKAMGI